MHRRAYRIHLAALYLAGALASGHAAGDDTIGGVQWTCTQERDAYYHVNCVPQRAGIDTQTGNADAALPVEPAPANGLHDMRPVAARGNTEVFSTRAWRIPLYTQSPNADSVTGLLKEVLCGSVPRCVVAYVDGPQTLQR